MGISCSITWGDILKVVLVLGFNLELCFRVYNVHPLLINRPAGQFYTLKYAFLYLD